MTLTRTLTVLTLSVVALLSLNEAAQAGSPQDFFRKIQQVQAQIGGGSRQQSPDFGQLRQPNNGYPSTRCERPPVICPPPVQRRVYCVYYLDCHGHWELYRCFNSRWSASSAEQRLQYQGYRTFLKVKHLGGGGYPGGIPASGPFASR